MALTLFCVSRLATATDVLSSVFIHASEIGAHI